MRFVVPASERSVATALARARHDEVTYALGEATPGTFTAATHRARLGTGTPTFATARHGLASWQAHRLPGLRVFPRDEPVTLGSTYLVTIGTPLAALVAPCRVTAVVDVSGRYGFTYATLPGHPEQGDERFEVALDGDDVVFTIAATSRPSALLAATPPARWAQRRATYGYLRALQRFVDAPTGPC